MRDNTMLGKLLGLTKRKGFSTPLRREIMLSLSRDEEVEKRQIALFTKIVMDSKTEEEAIQRIKDTTNK